MAVPMTLAARPRVTQCLECGKCMPTCPVASHRPGFSPMKLIQESVFEDGAEELTACTACGACQVRCHAAVKFVDYVREARAHVPVEADGSRAHACMFRHLDRLPPVPRNRWLNGDTRVADRGEVLVFAGCTPLFDMFFSHLGVRTTDAVRSLVRLMNRAGLVPAMLKKDVCCGHDALWSGDQDSFRRMAQTTIDLVRETGAKTVVTTCAECARCLGLDYPGHFGELPFRTVHATQWLAKQELSFAELPRQVTFQDPCRLGRHLGDTESPRGLMSRIPGLELSEMAHAGRDAVCCGTEGFLRCGAVSKEIQKSRLAEAGATGADLLLTACPKCQVHLACARRDPDVPMKIEIRDITEIIAAAVKEESR